jgi:hypothetical protein
LDLLSFMRSFQPKNAHNVSCLMLDCRTHLSSFIWPLKRHWAMDDINQIRSLIPLLIKFYEHSHPLTFVTFVDSQFGRMDRLNIFKMASSSSESIKECVIQKLLQFKRFLLDLKYINCFLD